MTKIDYTRQTIIVTGASSGLGAEFARQLSARGANLVLVARRQGRLEDLAAQIERPGGGTVTTIAMALDRPDAGRVLREKLESRGIHATGLINNAGIGSYSKLIDDDPDRVQQMLTLNISSLVDLTQAYFGVFSTQKTSVLVNIASVLGYVPTPSMAAYGASKAFVVSFTESLWDEARGTGLRVATLAPAAMQTEFFDASGSEASDLGTKRSKPEDVVAALIKSLDKGTRNPSIIPFGSPLANLPRFLTRRSMVRFMGMLARRNDARS